MNQFWAASHRLVSVPLAIFTETYSGANGARPRASNAWLVTLYLTLHAGAAMAGWVICVFKRTYKPLLPFGQILAVRASLFQLGFLVATLELGDCRKANEDLQ